MKRFIAEFPLSCRGYGTAPPCWTWPGLVPGLFLSAARVEGGVRDR